MNAMSCNCVISSCVPIPGRESRSSGQRVVEPDIDHPMTTGGQRQPERIGSGLYGSSKTKHNLPRSCLVVPGSSGSCYVSVKPMATVVIRVNVVHQILIRVQISVACPDTVLPELIWGLNFGVVVKVAR